MKVHLQVDGAPEAVAGHARAIQACGADGLFTFEGQHDVFLPLVVAAGQGSLELMTNVAIAGPRSPLHLAHSAWDLQVYSGGRFRLGLGSQIRPHIEKRYGASWGRPAARMAETVRAIKAIFAAWEGHARLDFRGDYFTHTLMPPNFNPGPNPFGPPPVLMGALGPVMTRTAAEVADGLLVMPFNSDRHFAQRTVPAMAAGLQRSGRGLAEFSVIAQVMVAMGDTPDEQAAATAAVSGLIAFYGSTPAYLPVLQEEGWADLQPELNRLSKTGDVAAMRALIEPAMVDRIGVAGTPAECAAEIVRRFGGYATEVCCYFPGYRPTAAQLTALTTALHEAR
ncbi:TIGR03617 family F420-dependent LLM class oxidoreductase [Mycolicibacterium fallax]|uniref:LLM class F420-dependent oxidoreductase n=1 Tax=Mycolicibacterium fallax TaxID=1793 RepID=A0A1X1RG48_MYCFA|nr:TIGR03617 family F420-dependent LLM class oxidoreductase [Mycolicibacterium fallax]ORV05097.1 LLM class F420-dependent oxidoreductase [Mycolicibacterium fallax]BBY97500.1 LLM class F420-dependent oxidoreductase [Mycolicibacterium fallax]